MMMSCKQHCHWKALKVLSKPKVTYGISQFADCVVLQQVVQQ